MEKEYHQMWIDFKPIYNTSESQTIFVRGLPPPQNTAGWDTLQHPSDFPGEANSLRLG